jgi:hypothetical protein
MTLRGNKAARKIKPFGGESSKAISSYLSVSFSLKIRYCSKIGVKEEEKVDVAV